MYLQYTGNDETAIHSRELAIQPIPFCGSSRTPNTSGYV